MNATSTQPVINPPNIPSNVSNIPTYKTTPPSTKYQPTISQPTYINSSTSIAEPIKPFDSLDHYYTPEGYLYHIEARVTFSLGLRPKSDHEYKFWHARRMAFVHCSLTGTALSWYIRLNDTYNQDWYAFVQAFENQFPTHKNAYYAQVEAFNLTKKDNETVRHFALKVQQLVEKGWCNESAYTLILKCNEIFTKGPPKNFKDFANKRQVKHTSTVLEPSIPFHTLPQITSINLPIKFCSYCHRTIHSISACFKKQQDDEDKRDAYARSKSPQKAFVQYFHSPSNGRTKKNTIHATEEVRHELIIITKTQTRKTDIALHAQIDSVMTKILLLHNTLDHGTTTTKKIFDITVLLIDLLTDLPIDMTLVIDKDHVFKR